MSKIKVSVYTNMNGNILKFDTNAIFNKNNINYYDTEHNKFVVDCRKKVIIKENSDYLFIIDLIKKEITITDKQLQKNFYKNITVIKCEYSNNCFHTKYRIDDEKIVNKYLLKMNIDFIDEK